MPMPTSTSIRATGGSRGWTRCCATTPSTGTEDIHHFGHGASAGEFVFAPRVGSTGEADGYAMTIVHPAGSATSELAIFAADNVAAGPDRAGRDPVPRALGLPLQLLLGRQRALSRGLRLMPNARQWLLNGHPRNRGIEDGDFKLVETEIGEPGEGQVLLKTRWLGFDPAQKGWMENIADYVAPMAIGDVMRGSGIAEVIASNDGRFAVGDLVFGTTGWTEYLVTDGQGSDQGRDQPVADRGAVGPRHHRGHRLLRAVQGRQAGGGRYRRGLGRRGRDRIDRRPARQDRRDAARSASPGVRTSAAGWSRKPATTRRSITRRATSSSRSRSCAPTAST